MLYTELLRTVRRLERMLIRERKTLARPRRGRSLKKAVTFGGVSSSPAPSSRRASTRLGHRQGRFGGRWGRAGPLAIPTQGFFRSCWRVDAHVDAGNDKGHRESFRTYDVFLAWGVGWVFQVLVGGGPHHSIARFPPTVPRSRPAGTRRAKSPLHVSVTSPRLTKPTD